jgi:hypothetical protein
MSAKNKRIAWGLTGALFALGIILAMNINSSPQQIQKDKIAETKSQTRENLEELKLKAAPNDELVDFFVDGLTEEELLTATENIDNSFTPYTIEATGVITTNF